VQRLSADLSIRHQKRRFGFTTLLPSSSSMDFLRMKESFAMNSTPQQG